MPSPSPPRRTSFVGALALTMAALVACQPKEGPLERAGKQIDQSVEKAGQQLEKAADKVEDATRRDKK